MQFYDKQVEDVSKFFGLLLSLYVTVVVGQDRNEQRCSEYKQQLYDENVTISYFHPDAQGVSFVQDHCKTGTGFIVGGVNALPQEFPFAARLGSAESLTNINWLCGGTIISSNHILTAAHCFHSPLGKVNLVRLGELDFNSDTDDAQPENYYILRIIEHPEYRMNEPYNDIGLIALTSNIKFSRYKHPACLPPVNLIEEQQSSFIAIGWGHVQFAGEPSSHLKKVTLQPYSHESCARLAHRSESLMESLSTSLQNSLLCAGSKQMKDTCQGDSGGPLLMQHPQYPCMHIIVGITSTGVSGCATPDVPSFYTRVKDYLNWMNAYIN
ncbi:serine protease snk-like [Musca autumnalis]|uniref:serine protease snk-like n=1 Tax=Musca autumnalis TaxID=221902 RepID=UPI003CF167A0